MFRRTKLETDSHEAVPPNPGGKGRPTPTRREAEAAAKARAKTPRSRKELAAAQRQARAESSQEMRQAMKTGDTRFLSAYPIDESRPCEGFGDNTLWIITEWDRSVTTALLPSEY